MIRCGSQLPPHFIPKVLDGIDARTLVQASQVLPHQTEKTVHVPGYGGFVTLKQEGPFSNCYHKCFMHKYAIQYFHLVGLLYMMLKISEQHFTDKKASSFQNVKSNLTRENSPSESIWLYSTQTVHQTLQTKSLVTLVCEHWFMPANCECIPTDESVLQKGSSKACLCLKSLLV